MTLASEKSGLEREEEIERERERDEGERERENYKSCSKCGVKTKCIIIKKYMLLA